MSTLSFLRPDPVQIPESVDQRSFIDYSDDEGDKEHEYDEEEDGDENGAKSVLASSVATSANDGADMLALASAHLAQARRPVVMQPRHIPVPAPLPPLPTNSCVDTSVGEQ